MVWTSNEGRAAAGETRSEPPSAEAAPNLAQGGRRPSGAQRGGGAMDFDLGGDWKEEWGEAGRPGASLV